MFGSVPYDFQDHKNFYKFNEPIPYGDVNIIGLYNSINSSVDLNEFNLIKGILTNNIGLVKQAVTSGISVHQCILVVTDSSDKKIPVFDVKDAAKKYSNKEIVDYLRKVYDAEWQKSYSSGFVFGSATAPPSELTYFTEIPAFDGTQLLNVIPENFISLDSPVEFQGQKIIGISKEQDIESVKKIFTGLVTRNEELIKSTINATNVGSLKFIQVVTNDFHEMNISVLSEAKNLKLNDTVDYINSLIPERKQNFNPLWQNFGW